MQPPPRNPDDDRLTVAERQQAVAELYASMPTMDCKGLCADVACTSLAMTPLERRSVRQATGVTLPEAAAFGLTSRTGLCTAVDDNGRCGVYAHRPMVCRLWGMVPTMRCPHGCEPVMSERDGRQWMAKVFELSGMVG